MSFVFRGTRADIESGYPGFLPERPPLRMHGGRPTNSIAFLVTTLLLFTILNSHQMLSNFLLWIALVVFLMATSLRMYATCQQLQAQAQAHAAATANGLFGQTELRVHIPPSMTLVSRGRLQGLRLQLALLDREFDDLDYDTLRALDSDNPPGVSSMSEEEINALPVHKYKLQSHQVARGNGQSDTSLKQPASSSRVSIEKTQEPPKLEANSKGNEEELMCTVCLEQVNVGELLRSLPCLHQFHVNCIDPWLRQQGTCPICKFRVESGWQDADERGLSGDYLV